MVSGKFRIHGRGACLLSLIKIRDDPFRSSGPRGINLPTSQIPLDFVWPGLWSQRREYGQHQGLGERSSTGWWWWKKTAPRGAAGWTKAKTRGSIKPTFPARSANPERIPRIPRAQGMARRRAGGAATWGRAGPQTMDAAAGGAAAAGTAGRRHLGARSPPPAPLRSPPPLSPPPPPPARDLIPDPRLLGPRSRHGSLSALQSPRPLAPGASRGKRGEWSGTEPG